jgi:hypothetical protein
MCATVGVGTWPEWDGRTAVDIAIVDSIFHAIVYGKGEGVDEFLRVQKEAGKPGTTGWWDRVLPELSDEQRDSLMAAAASKTISHRTISIVLGNWGYEVSAPAIGHWRRTHV